MYGCQVPIVIKAAGHCAHLTIEGHGSACGTIENGLSCNFNGEAGFVLDWADFEAAYLALKATRATAERVYVPFDFWMKGGDDLRAAAKADYGVDAREGETDNALRTRVHDAMYEREAQR
jgi:hypothetical protein